MVGYDVIDWTHRSDKMTQDDINKVYNELEFSMNNARGVRENMYAIKLRIEAEKSNLIASGAIDGKNETIRQGQIKAAMISSFDDLEIAEYEDRKAAHELQMARLQVERVKMQIKLMEVGQGE